MNQLYHDNIRMQELAMQSLRNHDVKRLYVHNLYYILLPLATYIVPRAWSSAIFFVVAPPKEKRRRRSSHATIA